MRLKVAGALPALDGGGPLVVMDIAAVQFYFDRIGVIHRIDLRLEPDAPREAALRADRARFCRPASPSPARTRRPCAPPGSRRPTA